MSSKDSYSFKWNVSFCIFSAITILVECSLKPDHVSNTPSKCDILREEKNEWLPMRVKFDIVDDSLKNYPILDETLRLLSTYAFHTIRVPRTVSAENDFLRLPLRDYIPCLPMLDTMDIESPVPPCLTFEKLEPFWINVRDKFNVEEYMFYPPDNYDILKDKDFFERFTGRGIAKADLYISVRNGVELYKRAEAIAIGHDHCFRPVHGVLTIHQLDITSTANPKLLFKILLHELVHILVFSTQNLSKFPQIQPIPTETVNKDVKKIRDTTTLDGVVGVAAFGGGDCGGCEWDCGELSQMNAYLRRKALGKCFSDECFFYIKTPKVVEATMLYFDNRDLFGMPLSRGYWQYLSISSHWDDAILKGELMLEYSHDFFVDEFISPMTMALLKDSGWYVIDDVSMAIGASRLVKGIYPGYLSGINPNISPIQSNLNSFANFAEGGFEWFGLSSNKPAYGGFELGEFYLKNSKYKFQCGSFVKNAHQWVKEASFARNSLMYDDRILDRLTGVQIEPPARIRTAVYLVWNTMPKLAPLWCVIYFYPAKVLRGDADWFKLGKGCPKDITPPDPFVSGMMDTIFERMKWISQFDYIG